MSNARLNQESSNVGEEEDEDTGAEEADAPRKRRRADMPISCELCQQRKVKCDRGKPKCGWCARNDQECVYKERRKPGLRAGYGRELEQRLERLEEIVQSQQEEIAELRGRSLAQSSILNQVSSAAAGSPPIAGSTITSAPATSGQGYGSSPARSIHDATYHGPVSPVISARSPVVTTSSGSHRDPDLPPEDLLISLTELFFKYINGWCPVLYHKRTIDELFSPSQSGMGDLSNRILMHAIIVASLRFSTDHRLSQPDIRERLYEDSKRKVLLYGFEHSTLKSIQALIILAVDLMGTSTGQPVRNLLAMAMRSITSIGLVEEPKSSPAVTSIYTLRAVSLNDPPDWIEEESRRRLFWCAYILDRYSTVPTALGFAFDDAGVERRLPCKDNFIQLNNRVTTDYFGRQIGAWNRSDYLGWFSHYVELVGVLTRIHVFLKKPIDITIATEVHQWRDTYRDIDRVLTIWETFNGQDDISLQNLVQGVSSNQEESHRVGWSVTHACHQLTVMRLHSAAAYPATTSQHFYPSYTASQRCLRAANRMCALAQYVTNCNLLSLVGPTFGFTLWVAARVLIVHGVTVERTGLNPDVRILVNALEQMGRHWRQMERYFTILNRVINEYNASSGEEGAAMKVLKDMRRTAYDLDYLLSRVPQLQQQRMDGEDIRGGSVRAHGTSVMSGIVPELAQQAQGFMDYVDTFDFFNLPVLPAGVNIGEGSLVNTMQSEIDMTGFGINPGTDWLS